jgi:hypothetical protein
MQTPLVAAAASFTTILHLWPLRFHDPEQLFDHPTALVPADNLARCRRLSDRVRGQQPPVQRFLARRRIDLVTSIRRSFTLGDRLWSRSPLGRRHLAIAQFQRYGPLGLPDIVRRQFDAAPPCPWGIAAPRRTARPRQPERGPPSPGLTRGSWAPALFPKAGTCRPRGPPTTTVTCAASRSASGRWLCGTGFIPSRLHASPPTGPRQYPLVASTASIACTNTPQALPFFTGPSPRRRCAVVGNFTSLQSSISRTCPRRRPRWSACSSLRDTQIEQAEFGRPGSRSSRVGTCRLTKVPCVRLSCQG